MIRNHLILSLLLWLQLLLAPSAFCYPISFTDGGGTPVTIKELPQRVVSLSPAATEILLALEAQESLAGITYHSAIGKKTAGIPLVGGFASPSLAIIKKINPDLIILTDQHEKLRKKLRATNATLVALTTTSLDASSNNILLLGRIFNREKEAAALLKKNRDQIATIAEKVSKIPAQKRKRVIRIMGRNTLMTPGDDSFQQAFIRAAGGISPTLNKTGKIVSISEEDWLNFNPQVIYACGNDRSLEEKILRTSPWKDVEAVAEDRIYYFSCDLTCRAANNTGLFVSWLAAKIYPEEFSLQDNFVHDSGVRSSRSIELSLDYVSNTRIADSVHYDFIDKTLVVEFNAPQKILSTLEGTKDGVLAVGNHYFPPPGWGLGHDLGVDGLRNRVRLVTGLAPEKTGFLFTGANMDNLAVSKKSYREMTVYALVTAGVKSNAVRTSKDDGRYYEPGTINILLLSNMQLSSRAMTRALITATEAKTAALMDMDIRSAYSGAENRATGTGTDNILVVQGTGVRLENAGGHTKLGELIAKAVYEGVQEAVDNQNGLYTERNIFMRLAERKISVYDLLGATKAYGSVTTRELSESLVEVLLNQRYAGFLAASLAISDAYEKGLIADLTSFTNWGMQVAGELAGFDVQELDDMKLSKDIPHVQRMALNALLYGIYLNSYDTIKEKS